MWETATETPAIPWTVFSDRIGVPGKVEWVESEKLPGYTHYLCLDFSLQPFAPTAPGDPGLVLHPPNLLQPFEDFGPFNLFSSLDRDNRLHYRGLYRDSEWVRVKFDWNHIPPSVNPLSFFILPI
jgi:hypothetical protein